MSLDTRYRPRTYADVLGQAGTIQILKQYVSSGAGFHQSYLFAGPFGSGKTTLARILARALLCSHPVDGEPCDKCPSCLSILKDGSSADFFEIDAATNSGKDSVRKIVEEIQYSTFSGKRKLYLLDESHRLSTDALDALLKPLEDNYPGTDDKMLVCLFCTTEPERMRNTILSRCAPAFVIRPVSPSQVGERLAKVCEQEGIPYERPALDLIGELTECHIRDALKAVEGVSMLGAVDVPNVSKYLHLDYAGVILSVLASVKTDLPEAIRQAEDLLRTMSPITAYERLSDMAMLAYRSSLGPVQVPTYLDRSAVESLGKSVGDTLLDYAERFAARPGRPTSAMLLCDLAQLHRGPRVQETKPVPTAPPTKKVDGTVKPTHDQPFSADGVWINPRGVNTARESNQQSAPSSSPASGLAPSQFFQLVKRRVDELNQSGMDGGQTGRNDVGNPGVDPGR